MTTIIRRDRRHLGHPALLPVAAGATILLIALAVWAFMVIWTKGGPQPVHDIVIAIPAPQPAFHATPAAGQRA